MEQYTHIIDQPHLFVDLPRRKPQILVVEDDLTFRPLWESVFFQSCPDSVIDWATTEELAERMIRRQYRKGKPYDLVVSDIWPATRPAWTYGNASARPRRISFS
ncbi:MAG TPA: hypothetical protein PKC28_05580 [Bdellovibrionales bacterium]|nr:hypothetical protein [Bdellovibrionales bacterium]